LRLASGPASNRSCDRPSWTRFSSSPRLLSPAALPPVRLAPRPRPCLRPALRPTLWTCIRLSLPVPALWRCRWLGSRPALGPASIWSPARAFSSSSGLNLQLLVVRRFSGCRCASVRTRVLRLVPFGLCLFLGSSVSPSVRTHVRSRGLRSQAGFLLRACAPRFRSTLLPPSGSGARPRARALRLLPFLPASLLACLSPALRLSPLRLRSEATLWHAFGPRSPPACACGPVWPSVPVITPALRLSA